MTQEERRKPGVPPSPMVLRDADQFRARMAEIDRRPQRGLSFRQLADMVGCHPSMIGHILEGRHNASPELAQKLEAALDVAPGALFRDDRDQPTEGTPAP